eukprot:5429977-Pyramimonas_sp.AAC.1
MRSLWSRRPRRKVRSSHWLSRSSPRARKRSCGGRSSQAAVKSPRALEDELVRIEVGDGEGNAF